MKNYSRKILKAHAVHDFVARLEMEANAQKDVELRQKAIEIKLDNETRRFE